MRNWINLIEGKGRSWVGDIGGTDIHEIDTRSEFNREIKKHRYLRGFLFQDRAYVWDGYGIVHPQASEYLRQFSHDDASYRYGVPVHLTENRITIRHHSSSDEDVRAMFEQVANSPIVLRLFGSMPEIWGENHDGEEERLDTKDWGEVEPSDWQDNWSVY